MKASFAMKVVIDFVDTPLLYDKLLACDSPRQRAMLLRKLAELACQNAGDTSSHPRLSLSMAAYTSEADHKLPSHVDHSSSVPHAGPTDDKHTGLSQDMVPSVARAMIDTQNVDTAANKGHAPIDDDMANQLLAFF